MHFASLRPMTRPRRRGKRVLVQRQRFLMSSVEQLLKLGPRHLRLPPRVVYFTGSDEAGDDTETEHESQEVGLDFGGIRRDWLSELAQQLFDPRQRLVDISTIDGTSFARLRPGADLGQLEAMGKVLGLALRDQQPLGVDVCAPLTHLLAHPRLPDAINSIADFRTTPNRSSSSSAGGSSSSSSSQPSCPPDETAWLSEAGRRELDRLGFSADWLRWVSTEEFDFWQSCLSQDESEAVQAVSSNGLEAVYGSGPVTLEGVSRHMERKALSSLVLDVSEELKALWRGLHTVPGLRLPPLHKEVRTSKKRRQELLDESRKRPRLQEAQTPEPQQSEISVLADGGAVRGQVRRLDEAATQGEPPRKRRRGFPAGETASSNVDSPLQHMISGGRDISVDQWKALTLYTPDGAENLPEGRQTVTWFWNYVESLGPDERSSLLAWVTGYRRLPPGSFSEPSMVMTIHLADMSSDRLPTAHTCGLQLELCRNYTSEARRF